MAAAIVPGSFCLTRYNVGGVALYHERLVLFATGYVLTPDMDDYGESLAPDADVPSVHLLAECLQRNNLRKSRVWWGGSYFIGAHPLRWCP